MLPFSSNYDAAISRPHQRRTLVRVFHGDQDVTPAGGLPIVDGSVSAALSSRVTRSLSLQVPFEYFPHNPDDLLSPYRAILSVESGIYFLDGTSEIFPLFTGRVYEATLSGDGGVTIRADDLAADVIAYRFERPQSTQPNLSVVEQIHTLISEAVDNPMFGPDDVDDAPCPVLTWDEDRGKALDDLASALRGRWYTLGNGSFVVREYPYLAAEPNFNIFDGNAAPDNGVIVSAVKTVTRDAVANSIVVVSERMDGSTPVIQVARDAATDSPTRFGGLFGKVSQILRPQTPLTDTEAARLARRQLAASVALTEQWNLQLVPIHPMEPGDTLRIRYRGVEAVQVVDSWTLPLGVSGNMTVQTRSSVDTPVVE